MVHGIGALVFFEVYFEKNARLTAYMYIGGGSGGALGLKPPQNLGPQASARMP